MLLHQESVAQRDKAQGMLGEKFGIITRGIEAVKELGIADKAPKVGEAAPGFTLPDARGGDVSLQALLKRGPVVLSFYRGEWCPFCNLELRAFQQVLPQIEALGATFVAVSPEKPEFGKLAIEKNQLTFAVLTDAGNVVAQRYSLVFDVTPELKDLSLNVFKSDRATRNADGSWELPIPATFVIDTDGTVRFAHVDPDYLVGRADPEAVLSVLKTLAQPVA